MKRLFCPEGRSSIRKRSEWSDQAVFYVGFSYRWDVGCGDEEVINSGVRVRKMSVVPYSRVNFPPNIHQSLLVDLSSHFKALPGGTHIPLTHGAGFIQHFIEGYIRVSPVYDGAFS